MQELTNAELSGLFTGAPGTCKDCKLEAAPPPQGPNVRQRIQTNPKYKAVKDNPPSMAMRPDTLALLSAAIPIDWNTVLAKKPTVFGDDEHLHKIIRSVNCSDFETNLAYKDTVPGLRKLVTKAPDQWTTKQRDEAEVAVTRLTKLEPTQVQLFSNKELLEFLRGL